MTGSPLWEHDEGLVASENYRGAAPSPGTAAAWVSTVTVSLCELLGERRHPLLVLSSSEGKMQQYFWQVVEMVLSCVGDCAVLLDTGAAQAPRVPDSSSHECIRQ